MRDGTNSNFTFIDGVRGQSVERKHIGVVPSILPPPALTDRSS